MANPHLNASHTTFWYLFIRFQNDTFGSCIFIYYFLQPICTKAAPMIEVQSQIIFSVEFISFHFLFLCVNESSFIHSENEIKIKTDDMTHHNVWWPRQQLNGRFRDHLKFVNNQRVKNVSAKSVEHRPKGISISILRWIVTGHFNTNTDRANEERERAKIRCLL